jgi:hypothetical protein
MRRHIRAILAAAASSQSRWRRRPTICRSCRKRPTSPPAGTRAKLRVLDWAGMRAAVSYTFDDAQPRKANTSTNCSPPARR